MVGAPLRFSANGGNLQESSGKYAAALYATPNATISTLLPYNGLPPSAALPPQNAPISYPASSSSLLNHPPPPLATSSTPYNMHHPAADQPIHFTYPPNPGPNLGPVYPHPQASAVYPPPLQQPQTYHPQAGYPPYPPPGAPAGYPSVPPCGSFSPSEYHSTCQPPPSMGTAYPPPPASSVTYPPRPY